MKSVPNFKGDHPLVDDLNRLAECVLERTPISSPECRIDFRGKDGFRPIIRAPKSAGEPGKVGQFLVSQVHKDHLLCNRVTFTTTLAGPADQYPPPNEVLTATVDSETVMVAKPHALRATPWHFSDRTQRGLSSTVDGLKYTYLSNGDNTDAQKNAWNYRTVEIMGPPTASGTTRFSELFPVGYTIQQTLEPRYIPGETVIYAAQVEQAPIVRHPTVILNLGPPQIDSEDVNCEWVDLNLDGRRWEMLWRKVKFCFENGDGTFSAQYALVRTSVPSTT